MKMPYKPGACEPITRWISNPNVLVVNAEWPYRTVADLSAAIRKDAANLAFGSSGPGQSPHMSSEMFLQRAGIRNVAVETFNGAQPPGTDRFDVIVLSGAVPFVPENLLQRLAPGGRLTAIVGTAPSMTAVMHTRTAENAFTCEPLFDTQVRPLQGFPQPARFAF